MHRIVRSLIAVGAVLLPSLAFGAPARSFQIVGENSPEIDPTKDYFSISIENGWLSEENSVLKKIFSEAKGGAIRIAATLKITQNRTKTIEDVTQMRADKKQLNQPLGVSGPVLAKFPADIDQVRLEVDVVAAKEERVAKLIRGIEEDKFASATLLTATQWVGYARAVSMFMKSAFDAGKDVFPFDAKVTISFAKPVKVQHLLLVASASESDEKLRTAKESDFRISGTSVLFETKALPSTWSFILFKIDTATSKSVANRMSNADEPWSTVIRTQLDDVDASDAQDRTQLWTIATNVRGALKNLEALLGADDSMSAFDRKTALAHYAQQAIESIEAACKKKKIDDCPTDSLQRFKKALPTAKISSEDIETRRQAIVLEERVRYLVGGGDAALIAAGQLFVETNARDWERELVVTKGLFDSLKADDQLLLNKYAEMQRAKTLEYAGSLANKWSWIEFKEEGCKIKTNWACVGVAVKGNALKKAVVTPDVDRQVWELTGSSAGELSGIASEDAAARKVTDGVLKALRLW